jgi:hypothetical protein
MFGGGRKGTQGSGDLVSEVFEITRTIGGYAMSGANREEAVLSRENYSIAKLAHLKAEDLVLDHHF